MKLQINKIALVGTSREFTLNSGLNIITGSTVTGKTTLMKCLRGLLGSRLRNFTKEASSNITHLTGNISIGYNVYNVIRPYSTTVDAMVSIGGNNEVERIPVLSSKNDKKTYGNWLLEKLSLPVLKVPVLKPPNTKTQNESHISLLSINDYMMFCDLRQTEIANSVLGHTDQYKNNKRLYVFEVIYGKYDVRIADLEAQRLSTIREINRLENYAKNIGEFLLGTSFENRDSIFYRLNKIECELEDVDSHSETLLEEIRNLANTDKLRTELLNRQQELDKLNQNLQYEQYSLKQKQNLVAQLQTQNIRLTKSIVAEHYLLDFDFLCCPRCGSSIQPSRTNDDLCYLCLQVPEPKITRNDLFNEQDRLERQIAETQELTENHQAAIDDIEQHIRQLEKIRKELSSEIDNRSRRYVSEQTEQIIQLEQRRTQLQEQKKKLEEYLLLYERQDQNVNDIEQEKSHLEKLDEAIEEINSHVSELEQYMSFLNSTYQSILQEIKVPHFQVEGSSIIDHKTYLPLFEGRSFAQWKSPSLTTMINFAHALAHQITCLHFDLKLPNILFIDGLSDHFGDQDLDIERIQAMYNYLIKVSDEYQDRLQIIVADNTVPQNARKYIIAEFREEDKLIPL
jgi:energy-coupling factor transporter ATP-binding protein EcfA2